MTAEIQVVFPRDELCQIMKNVMNSVLSEKEYHSEKVQEWTHQCLELITQSFVELKTPYKYSTILAIMQKNGGGLHTAIAGVWEEAKDGIVTIRWENKTMYCFCTITGLSF